MEASKASFDEASKNTVSTLTMLTFIMSTRWGLCFHFYWYDSFEMRTLVRVSHSVGTASLLTHCGACFSSKALGFVTIGVSIFLFLATFHF